MIRRCADLLFEFDRAVENGHELNVVGLISVVPTGNLGKLVITGRIERIELLAV